MPKRLSSMLLVVVTTALFLSGPAVAQEDGTWTGEVIDLACHAATGARGASNKQCNRAGAQRLEPMGVKNGQPMGLLTDDGTLVLVVADPRHGASYKALTEKVGERMQVTGTLAERGGMKVVTVTGSKAAG